MALFVYANDCSLDTTVDEIKAFCKKKLAHFKVPKYILIVDEFPTTVTGKIQKFKMREISIEKLSIKLSK